MSTEIEISLLTNPSEVALQHLASLLGDAFAQDPITLPILGGNRELAAPHMYAHLKAGLLGGEVYVACRNGEGPERAVGCTVWYPPGKEFIDVKDLVPERQEVDSQLSAEAAQWKKDVFFPLYDGEIAGRCLGSFAERRDLHYLQIIGTSPACQKQGIAGKLLADGVVRADVNGWPIALETCTPQNIRFYEKFGIKVLGQDIIPSDSGDIHFTVMRRPPVQVP